jgi:phospholipid/cholesterol/gamma-HCH transport system substrate-binding protein
VGFIGILVLLMLSSSAFFLNSLPLIGAGVIYSADFSEAAGLKPDAEVRVAGVKVGDVRSVELKGDKVRVAMQVSQAWIGDQTTASIQIKTVLGQKYIALDPQGSELADPRDVIPLSRTTSPYDVIEAFSDAADQIQEVDTNQLATSMRTLSDAFSGPRSTVSPACPRPSRAATRRSRNCWRRPRTRPRSWPTATRSSSG